MAIGATALILWIPLLVVTTFLWKRFGQRVHRCFLSASVVPLALMALHQLDLITVRPWPYAAVVALLTWCVISAYFRLPEVQIAAFTLASIYPLFKLADLAELYLIVLVSLAIVYACRRYVKASSVSDLILDVLGIAAFIAIPFVVLLHIHVGHFVFVLDMPYTLGLVGVVGFIIGILLVARNRLQRVSIRSGVTCLVCGLGILAGGLYWAQHPPDPPRRADAPSERPNIVLIVWDAVRAQQLHQYGYHRKTTPAFDKLAAEGMLFERAIAPGCWTLPTHASMFTGRWPRTHAASSGGYLKLTTKYDTIAELLVKAGYETIGLTGNHFWAGRRAGIVQGFQLFLEPKVSAEWRPTPLLMLRRLLWPYDDGAAPIIRALRRWLLIRGDDSRPFFLFINLFEAHEPYCPRSDLIPVSPGITLSEARQWSKISLNELMVEGPNDTARGWHGLRDLYDGEIRYVDSSTSKILRLLKSSSQEEDNLLIIVTADHGENLGEHDLAEHQFSVHDTLLHVPLVLRWQGQIPKGVRMGQMISTVDLFATIAEAAKLPEDAYASGPSRSLLPVSAGGFAEAGGQYIVAEVWPFVWRLHHIQQLYPFVAPAGRFIAPLFALYDGDWKYIRGSGQNREVLYNVARDPGEEHDLSAVQPERCARMSAMLDKWLRETPNNMPTFADGYEKVPLFE